MFLVIGLSFSSYGNPQVTNDSWGNDEEKKPFLVASEPTDEGSVSPAMMKKSVQYTGKQQ